MLSIFTLVVVMLSSYEDLEGFKWQEVEFRSAVVMILINSAGETSNQEHLEHLVLTCGLCSVSALNLRLRGTLRPP